MITPHEDGWIDECWGLIVIGIGSGNGKREMAAILEEVSSLRFDAGVKHEINRRTQEIANKLMGNQRMCQWCKKLYTAKPYELSADLDSYICDDCIPF